VLGADQDIECAANSIAGQDGREPPTELGGHHTSPHAVTAQSLKDRRYRRVENRSGFHDVIRPLVETGNESLRSSGVRTASQLVEGRFQRQANRFEDTLAGRWREPCLREGKSNRLDNPNRGVAERVVEIEQNNSWLRR